METLKKHTIMSVDDSEDSLLLTRRWLEAAGYEVVPCKSPVAALALLESAKPDLILLDVLMPEMNGYQFCSKLQGSKSLSKIPVVFLTALYSRHDKARAFAAGAVDFLVKPVRQERLIETIRKVLFSSGVWTNLDSKRVTRTDMGGFVAFLLKALNVPPEQADRFMALSAEELYTLATELGVDQSVVARNLARYLELPYVPSIDAKDVNLCLLPTSFCKARFVVPINTEEGERIFVVANPLAWKLLDDITSLFGTLQKPRIVVTEPQNFAEFFKAAAATALNPIPGTAPGPDSLEAPRHSQRKRFEAATMTEIEAKLTGIYQVEDETVEDDQASEESAPVILLVNKLIDDATRLGASDIHIEPWEKEVVVRYRVDGDLRTVRKLHPQRLIFPVIARIKIMASMSITERRLPQDGRIVYKDGIDLRVATAPTNFGEKAVMRLLDKKKSAQALDTLGFSQRHLQLYREKVRTPYGMILHVGPTGSGKSMTLFSALKEIQTPEINIQTIEDPIEYTLEGISQVQVNQAAGLTFARGLRSFLRQDPDVILVGEIRDRETADVAVEAALTGHLMLSTLHTNDSASTVTRLLEMGIEPYLISSSVVLICAQRLVRRLCLQCKQARVPTPDEKRLAGIAEEKETTLYFAQHCPNCGGTGYKGRIGVHELLIIDDALRSAMTRTGVTADELKRQAVEKSGMTTLYWDGMEKVRGGITSVPEVISQIRQDDFESRPA